MWGTMDGKINLRALKAFVTHELKSHDIPLTRNVMLTLPDKVQAKEYPIVARMLLALFDIEINKQGKPRALENSRGEIYYA